MRHGSGGNLFCAPTHRRLPQAIRRGVGLLAGEAAAAFTLEQLLGNRQLLATILQAHITSANAYTVADLEKLAADQVGAARMLRAGGRTKGRKCCCRAFLLSLQHHPQRQIGGRGPAVTLWRRCRRGEQQPRARQAVGGRVLPCRVRRLLAAAPAWTSSPCRAPPSP